MLLQNGAGRFITISKPMIHITDQQPAQEVAELRNSGTRGTRLDIAAREIYEAQGFPINKTSTIDSATVNPLTAATVIMPVRIRNCGMDTEDL